MVGNYVTAGVGNYVTDNPSNLGKYVTADTQVLTIAHSGSNCLCRMMVGVKA
ncbi:Uncharacterised protein [Mycobacterium tuberculosis]|uniref:Uncharacterized protein n=7 Tax=Mycobacterium TaxID=1763 RepID=A0A0T9B6E2_MYCTX|nr:hypothetical protein CAB90_03856 [Mycobacterium tuberculosis]CFE50604.1 Uncharacterised protein [Mycobacterium tuberculosis]CFS33156.1 Uncharacterised protein [Mycobacterium tuberculosis]CKP77053.1 Uncharacterised protein [Mycobacterium tuberculosis]COV98403.1 Uncharacterised protein [Mycobacterium tuberculosis]